MSTGQRSLPPRLLSQGAQSRTPGQLAPGLQWQTQQMEVHDTGAQVPIRGTTTNMWGLLSCLFKWPAPPTCLLRPHAGSSWGHSMSQTPSFKTSSPRDDATLPSAVPSLVGAALPWAPPASQMVSMCPKMPTLRGQGLGFS